MKKFLKKNILNIITILISTSAAFYTYKSTVVIKNIEKNNRYVASAMLIRSESERAIRYSENIFHTFEEYIALVNSDKAYKEMKTDVYNKPAEKIGGLVKEIELENLKYELIRIEGTEANLEISQSAQILNRKLDNMISLCTKLADTYSYFGKTKGSFANFMDRAGENKELISRRYELTKDEFKQSYIHCENSINGFKEEQKKFLNIYKKVLSKI